MPTDDYDTPWKDAVTRYFPEFMAFYFPQAHAAIDWACPHVFLDQELAQVARDAVLGRRLADKLVRVGLRAGGEQWVLVHIEIQAQRDRRLAERIFTYNYRVFDRYRRPVASLVLLADRSAAWRPDAFGYRVLGCEMRLQFPIVKLRDYAAGIDALLAQDNPFALLTAAHLLTQQTGKAPQRRQQQKQRLVKLLLRRDWERQAIMDLLFVLDWIMRLPAELEAELWRDVKKQEGVAIMPYMLSIERIIRKESRKQGREEGRQEGRKNGLEEGLQKGQATLLAALLTKRFGPLPPETARRLAGADAAQLTAWAEALLDAASLEEVFRPD